MILAVYIGPKSGKVESFASPDATTEPLNKATFRIGGDFETDYRRLRSACRRAAEDERPCIDAIGLAVAGKVSRDRLAVIGGGSLNHWHAKPVVTLLARDLECNKVVLRNDAVALALAEMSQGRGRFSNLQYIHWGQGVGGCYVVDRDGRPEPTASELGHQTVNPFERTTSCGCGRPGCLEAFTGGWSLARFGRLDKMSSQQWDEVLGWMVIGVYNTLLINPTTHVIFGGEVVAKRPWLVTGIQAHLRENPGMTDRPLIMMLSALGSNAVIKGALALLSQDE